MLIEHGDGDGRLFAGLSLVFHIQIINGNDLNPAGWFLIRTSMRADRSIACLAVVAEGRGASSFLGMDVDGPDREIQRSGGDGRTDNIGIRLFQEEAVREDTGCLHGSGACRSEETAID